MGTVVTEENRVVSSTAENGVLTKRSVEVNRMVSFPAPPTTRPEVATFVNDRASASAPS